MENDDREYSGSGQSTSAIPSAGKVVDRLDEFWDEVAEKTGQGKGIFIETVFGGMWRDNDTGHEQEKKMNSWFDDQTEDMKPLALLQAAFTSCAYAVDAMKAEKGSDLLEAWRCTSKANYCDLPPINRTSHFSKKSVTMENDGHENKQIQRRADHWLSEAGRSRHAYQGNRAQTRLQ